MGAKKYETNFPGKKILRRVSFKKNNSCTGNRPEKNPCDLTKTHSPPPPPHNFSKGPSLTLLCHCMQDFIVSNTIQYTLTLILTNFAPESEICLRVRFITPLKKDREGGGREIYSRSRLLTQQSLTWKGSTPRSNPLLYYITFLTSLWAGSLELLREKFGGGASIDKWNPFHIPSLELCIPLTAVNALPQNQNFSKP